MLGARGVHTHCPRAGSGRLIWCASCCLWQTRTQSGYTLPDDCLNRAKDSSAADKTTDVQMYEDQSYTLCPPPLNDLVRLAPPTPLPACKCGVHV